MKNLFLCFATMVMASAASAQIEKGTGLVGASSNFGFNNTNTNSTSVLNLNLKGAIFVVTNLAIGIRLDYSQTNYTSNNINLNSNFGSTTVGLFGRYYYLGKFFGGLGVTSTTPSSGSSYTAVPIEIGYAAFINSAIAVEPSFNFTKSNSQNVIGINIGFTLYLHRK